MKERAVLLSVRVVVAVVWLYNGLILKILFVDPAGERMECRIAPARCECAL